MVTPEGSLPPAQHEIMDVVWEADPPGVSVTEIWEAVSANREVTRTTVLNQVDRLEKRHWLRRKKIGSGFRYFATKGRDATARDLAGEFVDDFFGGSASDLMMSLVGSSRLHADEIAKLRRLLEVKRGKRKPKDKE